MRRLLPHVPFMDVHLFSLVLAKGGVHCRLLATFYLRKPVLVSGCALAWLACALVPPSHMWHAQAKAEWLYRVQGGVIVIAVW